MRKIGIIIAVLALVGGTWFFMQKTSTTSEQTPTTSNSPAPGEAEKSQPESLANSETQSPEKAQPETAEAAPVPAVPVTSDPATANTQSPAEQAPSRPSSETPSAALTSAAVAVGSSAEGMKSKSDANPKNPEKPLAAKPEAIKNCYTFEYRHHESAKAKDIESFLDFSNAFPLAAENVNKKSICVKVNQKPVEFQVLKSKGKEEIVLGPVVGPESLIRISYCTGTAQCRESCTAPKKRFMDDLLSDAHADEFQDSWGKAGADADSKELKAKSKELQALARTNSGLNDRAMMRDWNVLQKQEWACNQK